MVQIARLVLLLWLPGMWCWAPPLDAADPAFPFDGWEASLWP